MDQNSTNDTYTLYAMLYKDNTLEYSFWKIKNKAKKDITRILMEDMELEKKREFEKLSADTKDDIVRILLKEHWFNNMSSYKL